mgnify:CR=1 FL=1
MMGQRNAKDENGGGLRSHLTYKAGSLFPFYNYTQEHTLRL